MKAQRIVKDDAASPQARGPKIIGHVCACDSATTVYDHD